MSLSKLFYTKDWNNPEDFPTYETREVQVRADMQLLYDEIKAAFNKLIDDLKAAEIPFASSTAVPETNIQAAIENVQQQVADIIGGTLVLPNRSVAGEKLVLGAVDTTELADGAVTTAKIADANVTTAKLADANVTTAKIADANVTAAKLASDAVTSAKIKNGEVTQGKLGQNAVLEGNINANAVTAAKIKNGEVKQGKLGTDAVQTANIEAGAVTTAKLDDEAVTTAKIDDEAVTTAKLDDASVTTDKLGDEAVTTAKIEDGAVTAEKTSGVQAEHKTRFVMIPAFAGGDSVAQVNVDGVTAINTVIVAPAPTSFYLWRDAGVYCSGQGAGYLQFKSESAVTSTITANVIIMD